MKGFDLSRTIVLPAHCDSYGHMNVRNYAAFFDDAGWHMLAMAGISLAEVRRRGLGTVMASLTIEFHHEITAGSWRSCAAPTPRSEPRASATSCGSMSPTR